MSLFRAFIPRTRSFNLVTALRALWVTAIAWYELGTFYYHVSRCAWPDGFLDADMGTGARAPRPPPTHVLLVADPQVLDHRSYPGRAPWLMALSQWMVDLNMRKSWWATKQLRPDTIMFLGDMMDGGRYAMPNSEYEAYYKRFSSIFASEGAPVHYIPGNHDVGLGSMSDFSDEADERYLSHFGPLNQILEIADHTFVLVDAPGLAEEDEQRSLQGLPYARWAADAKDGPIAFIQSASATIERLHHPTVLLTHIPLARFNTDACGPHREKGTIRAGIGYGYQNTLSIEASQFLLQAVRPSIVFSGDDHDYCEYDHPLSPSDDGPLTEHPSVREVTVKSFSMAMGVRKPGFQLLSLSPTPTMPGMTTTLDDALCLLPDQLGIYLSVYVPLIAFSLISLLVSNAVRVNSSSAAQPGVMTSQLGSRRALRNADASSSGAQKLSALSLPMRRFDDEEDDDMDGEWVLPLPTPTRTVTGKDKRLQRTRLTVCGRTLDVSAFRRLLHYVGRATSRRKRRGLAGGFMDDLLSVAWMPVVLFVAIAWVMFL